MISWAPFRLAWELSDEHGLVGVGAARVRAVVLAADGPYISGHLGASWLSAADFDGTTPGIRIRSELEFDTGIQLGAAAGYDFGALRMEAEFGYRSHAFKKLKDLELNGIPFADREADVDIDTGTRWTPYVGAGIGFAVLRIRNLFVEGIVRGSDDDTVFAYQLAGGLTFEITEHIVADLGYCFAATSKPDFIGLEDYMSHNLVASARFSFW